MASKLDKDTWQVLKLGPCEIVGFDDGIRCNNLAIIECFGKKLCEKHYAPVQQALAAKRRVYWYGEWDPDTEEMGPTGEFRFPYPD